MIINRPNPEAQIIEEEEEEGEQEEKKLE